LPRLPVRQWVLSAPRRLSYHLEDDPAIEMTTLPVSLIGVPTDVGAGTPGARMGPEALRVAGIARAIAQFGVEVRDCGNLSGPANPDLPAVDGFRHMPKSSPGTAACTLRCMPNCRTGACRSCSAATTAWPSVRSAPSRGTAARAGGQLRVLWFDAHADFNTATMTPSGNIHGMPVACLCGHGPSQLTEIGGHVPAMSPHEIPPDRHS
jgi:arginase